MIWVNCVFISHSSTREHVQSRAPGIEDKGRHFFCALVGARPDLRTTLVDTEHTIPYYLVRSHSTCRRASAWAAVATGPAAACAAATCARAAVATCAAGACLRRIHREGQHWSMQRQVHRPVRPALSPQHARAASAYRHGRACSMLRGCTLS